jgi:hypothetical protein
MSSMNVKSRDSADVIGKLILQALFDKDGCLLGSSAV